MKPLLIVLLCFLLFVILLSLRIRLQIIYNDKGIKLFAKVLGFSFCVYPTDKNKIKIKAESAEKQEKSGGDFSKILKYIKFGKKVFAKLRRKLSVDLLFAEIYAASSDPYNTALIYGGMGAGVGTLLAALENIFIIKKKKICVFADFSSQNIRAFLDVKLSLTVFQLVFLAIFILREFIKMQSTNTEK